jgi:hypothetical protein
LIRTDFTSSGWTTPRRVPPSFQSIGETPIDIWARKAERLLDNHHVSSRTREEQVRALEGRVARVANKKCSVEEVATLHKELEGWLTSAVKTGDEVP